MSTTAATDEIRCIADIVRVHAARRGEAPAIECAGRRLTFAGLYDRAEAVAGALAASGVGPQDRVAVLERNGIEVVEVVFGAALLNAVGVTVNWRLAPPEILQILLDARATVLLVGPEMVAAVEAIEDRLGATRIIGFGDHDRWEGYEAWLQTGEARDPGAVAASADVAFQLYTSGTTGLPKGVMLTTSNLLSCFAGAGSHWGFEAGRTVNLAVMPMFHIAGLGWTAASLLWGCRTVIMRDVVPTEILRVMAAEGITHTFMVPAVIQMLLQTPDVERTDFRALGTLVYGASPISAAVLERAMATLGCDFIQVYGLTETTGAITQLEAKDHDPLGRPALLRSCGRPYPWVELRIVDAAGEALAPGEVGELWTRSPQNMLGYWNAPDATAAVLTEAGWFRTGDAGFLDEDGFVYLHDRVKDMIVTGGENVYPAEVENVLMGHASVADVAVFGVPDERWGEAVKAVVVLAAGIESVAPEDLIAFCRQQLAGYKCPKSVDFAAVLPRNPSGKLLKRELRAPFWADAERQVG
jgi:long-chain acyl-CoA synthetase